MRRRRNLLAYLESRRDADVVAVGEAAGYQGARWSGIAFTSERTLDAWGTPYARSSRRPEGWSEPSGTIVHRVLAELGAEERVLLWNTVPTHPHRPGEPLTNRKPTKAEIDVGIVYAQRVIELVRPQLVLAVGRVAEAALAEVGVQCVHYVRHPANGGARAFAEGAGRLFS